MMRWLMLMSLWRCWQGTWDRSRGVIGNTARQHVTIRPWISCRRRIPIRASPSVAGSWGWNFPMGMFTRIISQMLTRRWKRLYCQHEPLPTKVFSLAAGTSCIMVFTKMTASFVLHSTYIDVMIWSRAVVTVRRFVTSSTFIQGKRMVSPTKSR